MDLFIFRVGRWMGTLPFHLHQDGRTPAFRWLSWNTFIFICVGLVWHLFVVKNVAIVIKEVVRFGESST